MTMSLRVGENHQTSIVYVQLMHNAIASWWRRYASKSRARVPLEA